MTNYTMGSVYDRSRFDVDKEIVPANPFFKAYDNEVLVYEEREKNSSFFHITRALEQGLITPLDKTIISIVATFGSCCITKRALTELLTLLGVDYNTNRLESSVIRLHRYQLINIAHFKKENEEPAPARIIILTNYGSQLAKSLGIIHRFNPINTAAMTPAIAKSRCQTTQIIVNYLKNMSVDSFKVRPVIVKNPDEGAIVRPAASILVNGEYIDFEVPRRSEDWQENIADKLNRYKLCFEENSLPAIVINGEDEEMNREIHEFLKEKGIDMDILYTDDLAMFGPNFKYSLYTFSEEGDKLHFEFV